MATSEDGELLREGTVYLSGWLGKAQVIAFAGEPDKFGNPQWDVYVAEPSPKTEGAPGPRQPLPERAQSTWDAARRVGRTPELPDDWLDDSDAAIRDLEGRR